MPGLTRCPWAASPIMAEYHDTEWGVPSHDDVHLYEHLCLEGFQAGLSWELILKKRVATRLAFAHFNFHDVANFDDHKVELLLQEPGIIRNRLKVRAAITNAQAVLRVIQSSGSLSAYLWDLAGGGPVVNSWTALSQIPARTADSERISKELSRCGFKFVGPVGIYAFMQSAGMVNDHLVTCPRHTELIRPASLAPLSQGSSSGW